MCGPKKTAIIFFLCVFFFGVFFPAAAEVIILKNGNKMEGEIVAEEEDYIVLSTAEGRGRTMIRKDRIKSIEASIPEENKEVYKQRETRQIQPVEKKGSFCEIPYKKLSEKNELPIREFKNRFRKVFVSISGLVFIVFLIFVVSVKSRPFGVKAVSFLSSTAMTLFLLAGLLFSSLIINEFFIVLKGFAFFLYVVFSFGVPLFLLFLNAGIFYLRDWARLAYVAFLGSGVFLSFLSLVLRKDLVGGYFSRQTVIYDYGGYAQSLPEPVFSWVRTLIVMLLMLLILLYFLRKDTRAAFEKKIPLSSGRFLMWCVLICVLFFSADMAYKRMFIKFTNRPYLFAVPRKIAMKERPESMETEGRYKEFDINGLRCYVPLGMERLDVQRSWLNVFMDESKGRILSIDEISPREYHSFSVIERARWNPLLLFLKAISFPGAKGEFRYIKKIVSDNSEAVIYLFESDKNKEVYYRLNINGNLVQGVFMGDVNDPFVDENTVLRTLFSFKCLPAGAGNK